MEVNNSFFSPLLLLLYYTKLILCLLLSLSMLVACNIIFIHEKITYIKSCYKYNLYIRNMNNNIFHQCLPPTPDLNKKLYYNYVSE